MSIIRQTKIEDETGTVINPSTEEKQDDIITDTNLLAETVHAENTPHIEDEKGIMAMAVRKDAHTPTAQTVTITR